MELTPKAQTVELIRNSTNILILAHNDPDGDAIGSALALRLALQKIKKNVEVAMYGRVAKHYSFLPGYENIKHQLEASNDLIITIDTRATGEELRLGHKKLGDKHQVVIVVSPPRGSLIPEDVTIQRSRPKYDLVIILDTSAIERLGDVIKDSPDLLYETPTVAIDHHSTNSYFAKVNWVDMTSTATAEMLVSLIESLGRNESLLDADIATCLLTGLITDTGSFQNASTTPKSLTVAAQLIAAGARQQEIVEKLFKTKSLTTLKLWGKILSNIKEDLNLRFAWATITPEEITAAGANPSETTSADIIDELLKTVTEVDFVFLLTQKDNEVHGSMRSVKPSFNVAELAKLFNGGGHPQAAGFSVSGKLSEVERQIVSTITSAVSSSSTSISMDTIPATEEAKPTPGVSEN